MVVDISWPEKSRLVWGFGVARSTGWPGRPGTTLLVRSCNVIHGSTEHTTKRNTPKRDTKCDFSQLYISTTISIYDNILKLYNLDTI